MSKRVVNIGSAPNDGTGDSLRNGMDKINENFTEIYNTFGDGTTLNISNIGDAETLDGQDGSYYLDYNNFTDVPTDLSEFNNSVGFVTASVVSGYATETYVANALVGYATETFVNTGLALKANLTGANFTGVVTATQFVGDGSGLSGITAIGTGIEIEDDGSPVGTAATINFGSNITIAVSAGVATANVQVPTVYLDSNVTGIHTLSNVGIGTTNAESKLTVSGDVRITGVTTITGNYFYVGNPDITSDLTSGVILDTSGKITHQSVGGETHIVGYFEDIESYALSKDGNLYLGGGNPDDGGNGGNITILGETGRIGIGSTLPPSALTVVGNTSLETLNVSGVSTLGTGVTVTGTTFTDQLSVSGDSTFVGSVGIGTINPRFALEVGAVGSSGTTLYVSGDARVTGILTVGSSSISLDGINNILKVGSGVTVYGNAGIVSATSFYAGGLEVGTVTAGTIIYEGSVLQNSWTETDVGIHTLSKVGIGTTNPQTPLQVENVYGIKTGSGTFTASAGVAHTADSYTVSDFVNAEYTLFFQHSSGIQSQKVLVMDDGVTAYSQEYGIMNSSDLLVSVGATVKSGNVELWWTPETGVTGIVTYRYTRETMI